MTNINILIGRLTAARANNLDLLSDGTNGLAAIKNSNAYAAQGDDITLFNLSGAKTANNIVNIGSFIAPYDGEYKFYIDASTKTIKTGYSMNRKFFFKENSSRFYE